MSRLHAELYVAQLEVEVITAEVKAGLNVRHAIRALLPHEVRATTRFGEMEDELSSAVGRVKTITDQIWDGLTAWFASDLLRHSDSGTDLARRVWELRAERSALPGKQRDLIRSSQSSIATQLYAIRRTWARLQRDEALRQGQPAHKFPSLDMINPSPGESDHLWLMAESVADLPRQRMVDVAAKQLEGKNLLEIDPGNLLEDITDKVAATSRAGTDDAARQIVGSAAQAGRTHMAEEGPKPKYVYASELMDGVTCGLCAAVDGREWDSIEDAMEDYPRAGGYRHCEGGTRCRGTLVYVWDDEEDPTVDDRGR